MIKKLTLSEIQETCIDLLNTEISNLQILQPLNDKQILQVYNYANEQNERLLTSINAALVQQDTTGTFDDFYSTSNDMAFKAIIKAIDEYREYQQLTNELELSRNQSILDDFRKQEIDRKYAEHKKKFKPISNPVKATFCLLIKNSGHYKNIGITEFIINGTIVNRVNYLKAICTHYNLKYNIRMSKGDWIENDRKQYYDEIKELIYPKIDQQTINSIDNYIKSKNPHY